MKRSPQDAVAYARARLDDLKSSVGERHPDYASGLIQLALLIIMHGDPAEAEPLLRQALAIRKKTLGENHPDYATCLSSLAGLLWARSDLAGAEPLLRQALEIRCKVLGERHPKSIVSLNSLDQLLEAKAAWAAPARRTEEPPPSFEPPPIVPEEAPITLGVAPAGRSKAAAGPAGLSPVTHLIEVPPHVPPRRSNAHPESAAVGRVELVQALGAFTADLDGLGDRLADVAEQVRTEGMFPDDEFFHDLDSSRLRFDELRDQVLRLAETEGITDADAQSVGSVYDLAVLLGRIEQAESDRVQHGAARRSALAVLERVGRLVTTDRKDFAPLQACQEQARELSQAIAAPGPSGLISDAFQLAEGQHPLAALLVMVEGDDALTDEVWAKAHETVESQFGRALAVAVARGKITLLP